jgi:hypothetical protein
MFMRVNQRKGHLAMTSLSSNVAAQTTEKVKMERGVKWAKLSKNGLSPRAQKIYEDYHKLLDQSKRMAAQLRTTCIEDYAKYCPDGEDQGYRVFNVVNGTVLFAFRKEKTPQARDDDDEEDGAMLFSPDMFTNAEPEEPQAIAQSPERLRSTPPTVTAAVPSSVTPMQRKPQGRKPVA